MPIGHLSSDGMRSIAVDITDTTSSRAVDAFGRWRISNPVTLFDNKNIHDRNKNQWEEPTVGAILTYENLAGGPFQVAETITGGTSGTIGTITAVDGPSVTITYTVNHDDFEVGEQITGGTSGATADILTVGTGSTVTHDRDNAAVALQVGTGATDSTVRQTHRFISYVPGKGQLIQLTFLFGAAVANVRRRVGYFNGDNGLYFEQTNDGIRFVRRTKTSGSVVNNLIKQADWNIDRFDGSGPSKVTLDFTKMQFLYIDFQWQGTGRIRFGFFINGRHRDAHHLELSNSLATVWTSTPSLPLRYEIQNTAATSGVNTMKEFCSAVISEGGERLTGLGYTKSNDITPRAVTTEVPVLAIRLKNDFNGENRKTLQIVNGGIFATGNAAHFEIAHIHDPTGITATWTDVGNGSAVEFSTNITAVTGNPRHNIEEGYAAAGAAGKGGGENEVGINQFDQHRFATQNIDSTNSEMFVIFAASLTGTSNVYAHLSWIEFE